MYNKKQCFAVFLITAVISMGAGLFLAGTNCDKEVQEPKNAFKGVQNSENTFQAGWKAAEDRLKENGFIGCGAISGSEERNHLNGEILEIKGNKIYLRTVPLNPLANPELNTRIVEISGDTEIYQLTGEEQRTEGQPTGLQALRGYKGEETKLFNVELGRTAIVFTQDNVAKAKQFKAIKIIIWPLSHGSLFVEPIES